MHSLGKRGDGVAAGARCEDGVGWSSVPGSNNDTTRAGEMLSNSVGCLLRVLRLHAGEGVDQVDAIYSAGFTGRAIQNPEVQRGHHDDIIVGRERVAFGWLERR